MVLVEEELLAQLLGQAPERRFRGRVGRIPRHGREDRDRRHEHDVFGGILRRGRWGGRFGRGGALAQAEPAPRGGLRDVRG